MTSKVFTLMTIKPGIQRDGTNFASPRYVDGLWVRFQRGLPRKIGGYNALFQNATDISRGLIMQAINGLNYIYSGQSDGVLGWQTNDYNAQGSGPTVLNMSNAFSSNVNNLWQWDLVFDPNGTGQLQVLGHPGQNLLNIDNSINTPVMTGTFPYGDMTKVGVFTNTTITTNGLPNLTISPPNYAIGAGLSVSGTGIPASTTIESSTVTSTQLLSSVAVTSTSGTFSASTTSGLFVGQTVSISGSLGTSSLSSVTVTGTSGTFSCTPTTGLYVGQSVTVGGSFTPYSLSSVAITGSSGTFSCTSTVGLAVDQTVYVSGAFQTTSLSSVTVTSNSGQFSCASTSGLYVGMPITVTGTQSLSTISGVAVTGTAGQCSCTATTGLYIGQPVIVTGTLTGSETGINSNQIYYIISTNGTTSFTLSATYNGTAITTTAGTTTGLVFQATLYSGVYSNTTYYITATNGTSTFTLSATQNGPAITTVITSLSGLNFVGALGTGLTSGTIYYIVATNGTSTFSLSNIKGGTPLSATYGSTTGLSFQTVQYAGISPPTTYYVIATNGTSTFTLSATSGGSSLSTIVAPLTGLTFTVSQSIGIPVNTTSSPNYYIIATDNASTFTLSATQGGSAVTTIVAPTTGLTFTLGTFQNVIMTNNATATGSVTLTYDNNISVSGGVCVLYPYTFVYGNNGLIQNNSAGNLNNWIGADANQNNVSGTKVVKGMPLRGGTTSPAGLFWSTDQLTRVTYAPQNVGTSTIYWRYDIISTQTSIMSSQCVIEYDGIYYWCGTDRFLMYNGVVQEIPNSINQNYFFDNLNYFQRQKVWVSKIPRYGEIWWFYPSGNATECNNAIIYNVREQTWYDAGFAMGANRSAGIFTEVFRYPIWADNTSSSYSVTQVLVVNGGSGYAVGDFVSINGQGAGAICRVATVSGSTVLTLTLINGGNYSVAPSGVTTTTARPPSAGTGLTVSLFTKPSYVLWQHETGKDSIINTNVDAVPSYIETNSLGWVNGGIGNPQASGDNAWIRVERVEPDFVQNGSMSLYIKGKGYADEQIVTSQLSPYVYDQNTLKIDMKEQYREMRMRFESNTFGGDYQMGNVLVHADIGDVRGTGNP